MSEQPAQFCVFLELKRGTEEAFLAASRANQTGARKEPGNLRFDIYRSTQEPQRFLFVEAYNSEAAVAKHRETAHFIEWLKTAEPMLVEPRKRVPGQDIPPGYALISPE